MVVASNTHILALPSVFPAEPSYGMNGSFRCLTSIAISMVVPALSKAQETTTPVGVTVIDVPSGNTALSIPFLKQDLYRGSIVGISEDAQNLATTITVSEANWAVGRFNEGAFPKFYVEFQQASQYSGLGLDVIESGPGWIKVAGLVSTDFGISVSDVVVIRSHYVIDDLFTSLSEEEKLEQRRCLIKLFYADGETGLANWTGSSWSSSSSVLTTGETPIYPGQGFILGNNNPLTLVHTGNVRTTPLLIPVYAEPSWNFFGSAHPVPTTIGDMSLETFMIPYADVMETRSPGSLSIIHTYVNHGGFLSRDGGNDNGADVFPSQEAGNIQTNQAGYYLLPSFYQEP